MGMESGLLIIWDYATHVRRAQCHHSVSGFLCRYFLSCFGLYIIHRSILLILLWPIHHT